MMMMKRLIPILLILSLLLSLASCVGNYGEVDLKKPVALSEDGIVEKELLDKIKNENAIATFTGTAGGLDYEWTIFGSDLDETKDVNLLVTLEKADGGIKVSFADNESFGFTAILVPKSFASQFKHKPVAGSNSFTKIPPKKEP